MAKSQSKNIIFFVIEFDLIKDSNTPSEESFEEYEPGHVAEEIDINSKKTQSTSSDEFEDARQ